MRQRLANSYGKSGELDVVLTRPLAIRVNKHRKLMEAQQVLLMLAWLGDLIKIINLNTATATQKITKDNMWWKSSLGSW